ncbi:hypothetical protein CHS0354_023936 [Potamilus streckersoni]|uniref:Thoeris protein ThsB TIR-like domain-containing protein n=1 Tax=Potamilus streckersoni TaxID=2493646 RepID=A0AAE0VML5_9BIVA|nr:hypothetical protein CHS0354_023936 [Potamilus streckersoni]
MAKKKVFVSFDYENDRHYKNLLKAWDANPEFDFYFSDISSEEIQSWDIPTIKSALTTKINQANYTLVIVGEYANTQHKDCKQIGYKNWINFEIAKSKANKNKLVAVKIDSDYTSPDELLGAGAEWAMSFNRDAIIYKYIQEIEAKLTEEMKPFEISREGECASPEPTKYTITFNSDNGTAVSTITVTSGNKATKPTNPSKTGYTFVDWYKEATLTNVFDFNTAITANITLYAKWTAVSYKVTLDANKGTPGTTTTITVEQGKTVPTSTTGLPTFTGHTLVGWNTKADGTGTGFVFGDTPVFADITLYAKWTINVYIVTLDANGGTPGTTTIIKVEHGKTVPTSTSTTALPTFTGHNFLGWKTKADDTGTGFVFGDTPVFADITLYAQWSNISYTVTLDPNGGTAGSTTKVSVYHGQTVPSSISINNLPTRMNYQLLGWNTSADGKGSEFVFGTTVFADITIYAKWTINVYTVTLDANGGTPGTTTIIEVEHGKTVPTSTTGLPTFTGYNL